MDKLVEIAAQIQHWLDYQERERGEDGVNDDVHLMSPPVWPTRGQLKNWIRALTADAGMERAAEIYRETLEDLAKGPLQCPDFEGYVKTHARYALQRGQDAIRAASTQGDAEKRGDVKLWLWKNFVDGRPEYWAFDNPYPTHGGGDPMTLGEPCGYALFKESTLSPRHRDFSESDVIAAIHRAAAKSAPDAGQVVVPVEPSYRMVGAGMAALSYVPPDEIAARHVYKAMLRAAGSRQDG